MVRCTDVRIAMNAPSWRRHARAMLLALACGTPIGLTQAAPPALVITDVRIVDVVQQRVTAPRTIVIEGDRIVAVEKPRQSRVPADALRVDGRGRYAIPGLIDAHVHLFNLSSGRAPNDWAFPLFVANGVTGVREMRTDAAGLAQIRRWQQALAQRQLIAPRVLAAGIAVRGDSAAQTRAQVDAAAAAGADFIKVFSELPASNWQAAIEQAHARGLSVHGHVPYGVALTAAARAGQRSNEHLTQAPEACTAHAQGWLDARAAATHDAWPALVAAQEPAVFAQFRARPCTQVGVVLAGARQAQVPTLVLAYHEAHRAIAPQDDARFALLRADEQQRWLRIWAEIAKQDDQLARRRWRNAQRIVDIFHRAGAPIVAGTDAPMPSVYPGFALHEEMAQLVDAGLTPMQALRAATWQPARLLGADVDSGSVDVGKRADLVLLDANPSRDIANTRRIHAVILGGRRLRRAELDALLIAP